MKQYNFDQRKDRHNSNSLKWDHVSSTSNPCYPLWVADMDFACSDAIVEALTSCANQEIYGYSLGVNTSYRRIVKEWLKKRFDFDVEDEEVFYCCGVVPALSYLIEILSKPGDGIVIQPPVYFPFRKKIEVRKRKVVENPLRYQNGEYTIDFDHLETLFQRDDVKGMIFCSPHNPVGRVWSEQELQQLIDLASKYDKWIISDEIHADLIRCDQVHHPLAKIANAQAHRIITCTAPSKTFNLAGLQVSNIIIKDEMLQKRWKEYVIDQLCIASPNVFAIAALHAAYGKSEDWLAQLKVYLDENIKTVQSYLEKQLPKAIITPCEGTYLMWVNVSSYCSEATRLEQQMIKHGLIFDEGYLFGSEGEGFERINVACPRAFLMEAMEVFVKAIKALEVVDEQ